MDALAHNVLPMAALPEEVAPPKPRAKTKPQKPHTCPDGRMNEAAAAEYLGCSRACLKAWRTKGKGPTYYRIGCIWYFKDDLDLHIQEHVVDPER